MKEEKWSKFYLVTGLILLSFSLLAQQEYFSRENKSLGLNHYRKLIYQTCNEVSTITRPIFSDEMKRLSIVTLNLVTQTFYSAFKENPKLKLSFEKDLELVANSPSCLRVGNHCRADLLAMAIYYYKKLRPDMPGCRDQGASPECRLESEYRNKRLAVVPELYKKNLLQVKNDLTKNLFDIILADKESGLHICKTDETREVPLLDDAGDFLVSMDFSEEAQKKEIPVCKEEISELHQEFVPGHFDQGRTTVGKDQVEPVKEKIALFIKSHPEVVVTSVKVVSTSAKLPFYETVGGKRLMDPKSQEKNLSLAQERASFLEKSWSDLKVSNSSLQKIELEVTWALAGPDFIPLDLNDRFVTRLTPGYVQRLEALHKKFEKQFKEEALKPSAMDLLDESKFGNLFQAKFKPFQGFRISISGFKKEDSRCTDYSSSQKAQSSKATKQ